MRVLGVPAGVPTASALPPLMQVVAGQHRSTSKGFTLSTFLFEKLLVGRDVVLLAISKVDSGNMYKTNMP